ncbi:Phospholipase D1, partial [Stegodyphus mimosarum]
MQSSEFLIDIRDPASDRFYREIWQKTATENAHIYEEVFQCIPTDKVRNFHQLREYQAKASLANLNAVAAREKAKKIRGHLVAFPMLFLCEEKLKPTLSVKEHYLPNSVWT